MNVVSVSPKFQVVIPKAIREVMALEPGQKMQVFQYGDRVELVPVRSMAQAKGFLAGIDSAVARDEDRV